VHFWWWEFRLIAIRPWTFPLYWFIALYAVLLFLLCVPHFPEQMTEHASFKDYFYSRKNWIFSLMILLFLADFGDTLTKVGSYLICWERCTKCGQSLM